MSHTSVKAVELATAVATPHSIDMQTTGGVFDVNI